MLTTEDVAALCYQLCKLADAVDRLTEVLKKQ